MTTPRMQCTKNDLFHSLRPWPRPKAKTVRKMDEYTARVRLSEINAHFGCKGAGRLLAS